LRRKYEHSSQRQRTSRKSKSKKDHDSSNCIATVTVILGAIVVVMTVGFTVMEIVHNRNTQIRAYPVDPNEVRQSAADSAIIKPPPYPGPSTEAIKAELERSKQHQESIANGDGGANTVPASVPNTAPQSASSRQSIPQDFPPDHDMNTMTDLIGTVFKNTEFFRRFRGEGVIAWTEHLSHSKAIYNDSLYDDLPICVQVTNTKSGYGYRVWRDAQVHYHSSLMSCTMAVHWGQIPICPPADDVNMFEFLFYSNFDFAASHRTLSELNDAARFQPIGPYNEYFSGAAKVMYDLDGPFIAGNMNIVANAEEHILVNSDKREGMLWPEKATKYDRNRIAVVADMMLNVGDIDPEYANVIGWNGGMAVRPVLNYYGLEVVHLRYRWRKKVVDFLEEEFRGKFVIGFHVQMGNGIPPIFGNMADQIVSVTQYLLGPIGSVALNLPIKGEQPILVYISTDCGGGEALNNFINSVRFKVNALQFDDGRGPVTVNLRVQKRLPEGNGHPMQSGGGHTTATFETCVEIFANGQMDAEILGLTDVLVLPAITGKYTSSFTRLSRALMMQRHKTICKGNSPSDFECKNFEGKQTSKVTTSL